MFKRAVRAVAASGAGLLLWKHRQASKGSSHVLVADEVRSDHEIVSVAPPRPESSEPTETALASTVVVRAQSCEPTVTDLKEDKRASPVKLIKEKLGKTFAGLVTPSAFGASSGPARATMTMPFPLIPIIPTYLNVTTKEIPAQCSSSVEKQPVKDFPLIFAAVQDADARNNHGQCITSELLADCSPIRRQVSPYAAVDGHSTSKFGTIGFDQDPTSAELDRMREWLFSSPKEIQHSSNFLTENSETPTAISADQDSLTKDCPSQEQDGRSELNTEMPSLNRSTEIVLEAESRNKDLKNTLAKLTGGFAPDMRRRPRLTLRLASESLPTDTKSSDISNVFDDVSQARNGEQIDNQPDKGCKSPPGQCKSPLRSRSRKIFRLPSPSFSQASTDESSESMHGLVFSASFESGEESLQLGPEVDESSVTEEKWYEKYRCSGDSSFDPFEHIELDVQILDAAKKQLMQDGSPELKHDSRYRTPRFEFDDELYCPEKKHILRSCPDRIETAHWEQLIDVVEYEASYPRDDHVEELQAEEDILYLPWTCPGRTKISSKPPPIPEDEYASDMLPTCPERISNMEYGEVEERSPECREWAEQSSYISHNKLTFKRRPQTLCSKREYNDNQEHTLQILRPMRLEEEFESCRAKASEESGIEASDVLKGDQLRSSTEVEGILRTNEAECTLRTNEAECTLRTTKPLATTEADYGVDSAIVSGYEADEDDKFSSEEDTAHDLPISALRFLPTELVTAALSSSMDSPQPEEVSQGITEKTEECVFNSNRGGGICYFSEASDGDKSILDAEQILEKFSSPPDKWDSCIEDVESDGMTRFKESTQDDIRSDYSGHVGAEFHAEGRIASAEAESESVTGEGKTSELSGNDDVMQDAAHCANTDTMSPSSNSYNACAVLKGAVALSTELQHLLETFDDDTHGWGTAVEEIEWEVDENVDVDCGDGADCEDPAGKGDADAANCTGVEIISLQNLFQESENPENIGDGDAAHKEVEFIFTKRLFQEGTDSVQDFSVPDLEPTQVKLTSSLGRKGVGSDQQVHEDNREKQLELTLDSKCDVRQGQIDQPPVKMQQIEQALQFCENASVRRDQPEAESPRVECQGPTELRIFQPDSEKNNNDNFENAVRESLPPPPSSPKPLVGLAELTAAEVSLSSLPDGAESYKKRGLSPFMMFSKESADDSKIKNGKSPMESTEVAPNKQVASATEQRDSLEHVEDTYDVKHERSSKGSETLANDEPERPPWRRKRGKRGSRNGGKKSHQALSESASSPEILSGVVPAVVEKIVSQTIGDIDGSEPATVVESKKPRRRGRRGGRGLRRQKEKASPEAEEKVGRRLSKISVAGYIPSSSSNCLTSGLPTDDSSTDSCSEPEAEEKRFAKNAYCTTAQFLPLFSDEVTWSGSTDSVAQHKCPIHGQSFTLVRSIAHLRVASLGDTSVQSQAGKSEPVSAGEGEEVLSQSQKRRLRRKRATVRRAGEQRPEIVSKPHSLSSIKEMDT